MSIVTVFTIVPSGFSRKRQRSLPVAIVRDRSNSVLRYTAFGKTENRIISRYARKYCELS